MTIAIAPKPNAAPVINGFEPVLNESPMLIG